MWSEDLADNVFVVLVAYLAVGIPLNFYLYHDVIDSHWRSVVELRGYSIGYGMLAGVAFVLLFLYGLLQIAAEDYKEAGAAFLSCAIAVYGLYLCRRQTRILRFFDDHLQRRADAIVSVYKNDRGGADATALFSREEYKQGEARGHISSVFLDDNYPGEGPRVTWLQRKPEVKDVTEMTVRTGLWIRLAVTSSTQSFFTALRPSSIPSGDTVKATTDVSEAWTLAVIKQCFEGERERCTNMGSDSVDLETFIGWVDGKQDSLSKWREILSFAPDSEWKEALAEFPSTWTEGLKEEGVAFEVYLTLALHPVEAEEPTESRGGCWPTCTASHCMSAVCGCRRQDGVANASGLQSLDTRDAGGFRKNVYERIHSVLGDDGFVTSAVLMAGFPQDHLKLGWLKRVQQLAEIWHRLAESTATDPLIQLDRMYTEGVDLVVALALLLDADKSPFEFSQSPKPRMKEALEERRKLVVRRIQGGGAETLLKEALRCLQQRGSLASDIAQAHYSLGKFLQDLNRYAEAHDYFDVAIKTWESPRDARLRNALISKADMFVEQRNFEEAEQLYRRSAIDENVVDPDDRGVAEDLTNKARLLTAQAKYDDAEPLFVDALAIRERVLGADHPDTITCRVWIADLYTKQGLRDKGLQLLQDTVKIFNARERGRDNLDIASALNNGAEVLRAQAKFAEAEPLYERSQTIREAALGPYHHAVATVLNNRAKLAMAQGKYPEAELLFKRSLAIREHVLGTEHPDVATVLNGQGELSTSQGKYFEAELLFERSKAIREKVLGPEHPDVAESLNTRAELLSKQGKYGDAGPLYERSQAIRENVLGPEHPDVAESLNNRAELLRVQGKYAEAEPLCARATEIWEKALGLEHPLVATALNNRALLLESQGKFEDADPLYIRVLEILGATVGEEHPNYASTLNNRAGLLESQGKYEEAEPLYQRSLAIDEKVYGPDHPEIATDLNNWAWLLESQGKHNEAIPLLERAASIRMKVLGESHHSTVDTRISLERVRKHVLVNTRLRTPGDEKQAGPSS